MSDAAKLLGLPDEITIDGRQYPFYLGMDEHAKFSVWVAQQAFLVVQQCSSVLAPAEYAEQMAGVRADAAGMEFDLGTVAWIKARNSQSGRRKYLELGLVAGRRDLDPKDRQLPNADTLALRLIGERWDEMDELLGAWLLDPKAILQRAAGSGG